MRVSVVVDNHNDERFLRDAIDSTLVLFDLGAAPP
jgi:hypothetical protein